MSAPKHTPGPWKVDASGCVHQQGNKWSFIPLISPWAESAFDHTDQIALANARLIAAAPDLLAALQELYYARTDKAEAMACAAIAKATGEDATSSATPLKDI